MIGPIHPEVGRALQRARRDDLEDALRGCRRRTGRSPRGDR
ncbi:MAG TPA: hypothetical protein VFQ40_00255 [Actinomycetota bacterium]|nr:hypothetical protein [Actinomycetota bacterium]